MTAAPAGGGLADLRKPGALPPVPVDVPADAFDNLVREWGVGFCCEWFGHHYDSEFTQEIIRTLQERNDAALAKVASNGGTK